MKNKSRFTHVLLLLGTLTLFWNCASSKKASEVTTQIPVSQLASTAVNYSTAQSEVAHGIQAKSSMTFALGGSEFSLGGNLKMIRDEIIQISMSYIGLFEVGRIELTPSYILIQDRYDKLYIKAAWDEICLDGMGMSFQTFQSLFWEELFLLGSKEKVEIKDFVLADANSNILVPATKNNLASSVQFVVDGATGRIRETQLGLRGAHNLDLSWKYLSHTTLGDGVFPNSMQLTSTKLAQQLAITLNLSNVEINNNLHDLATNVNDGKYKAITIDDVLNLFRKLVK